MPGGRGGRRQGTPGKSYTNRTDLNTDYAPSTADHTPASGGVTPQPQAAPMVYPEDVPKLDDPTMRPGEPVTAGMDQGPGPGKAFFPITERDPNMDVIRAAYARNPTPQLERVLRLMQARYGDI